MTGRWLRGVAVDAVRRTADALLSLDEVRASIELAEARWLAAFDEAVDALPQFRPDGVGTPRSA